MGTAAGHAGAMVLEGPGLRTLTEQECRALLADAPVGRVAVNISALPAVLPVPMSLWRDELVIRSLPGTRLAAALRNSVVAVEADHYAPDGSEGWCVLVRGRARVVTDAAARAEIDALPFGPWPLHLPYDPIAVELAIVSGRELSFPRVES